jgi:toxin ParE1/3/4
MTNRFRKRSQADADLESIWRYIAADSTKAADRRIDRIGEAFKMLVQNPLAGRERPELADGLRSFSVANHVIFYFAQADGIEIVRVMSGRRDITSDDME